MAGGSETIGNCQFAPGIIARRASEMLKLPVSESAWRSALTVESLQRMGVENIAEMADGFKGWRAAGLPVEVKD